MRTFVETFNSIELPIIYIAGKCDKENTALILESDKMDLWFHLTDYPSAHLICKINNIILDKVQLNKIVKRGAILLKSISKKYKSITNLSITYTFIKNVNVTLIDGLAEIIDFKIIKN